MSDEPNAAPASDWQASKAVDAPARARAVRMPRLPGELARLRLVAHETDRLGRGADERDRAGATHLGEGGVLGEETVPRVDRLAVGDGRRGDDRREVEVAQARRVGSDADGPVGGAPRARA